MAAQRPWYRAAVIDVALVLLVASSVVLATSPTDQRQLVFSENTAVVLVEHTLARPTWLPVPVTPATSALVVSGRVRNAGSSASGLIRVRAVLLDESGTPLGTAVGFPPRWSLPAGAEATFVAPSYPNPRVTGYILRVEEAR